MNSAKIPEELKSLHQWVVWKSDKSPRNALTLEHAAVDKPSSWSSFDEAKSAVLNGKAKGVGFVLTAGDPYTIFDLDHVIDSSGLKKWALDVVNELDSWTEYSQSMHGLHIIVRGKIPANKLE
jgi:putative DNA primase/helicase